MQLYKCEKCGSIFKSRHEYRNPKFCSKKCYQWRVKKAETLKKMSLAKIGKTPWNKGVKMWKDKEHPRGTLGKIGLGKGRKAKDETKKKLRESHLGLKCPLVSREKHWNWQGGITEPNEAFRKSAEYKNWRIKVFERDKYTCQICSKIGGMLHADHIHPFSRNPERRLDIENGRTLCLDCHKKTNTYGGRMLKLKDK
jgi:hypothetical protein